MARHLLSTAPVRLPALPHSGGFLTLHESFDLAAANGKELGGAVWPAAALMCRWLGEEVDAIAGARVLELGCGTGACGLYAAALGAQTVTLTDGGGPELLQLVRKNVEANRDRLADDTHVEVETLAWGDLGDSCLAAGGEYDFVLAADVLYGLSPPEAEQVAVTDAVERCEALASTMEALLLCAPGSSTSADGSDASPRRPPRIVVAHEYRNRELSGPMPWDTGDAVLEYFVGAAARRGLSVTQICSERPRVLSQDGDEYVWSADLVLVQVTGAV